MSTIRDVCKEPVNYDGTLSIQECEIKDPSKKFFQVSPIYTKRVHGGKLQYALKSLRSSNSKKEVYEHSTATVINARRNKNEQALLIGRWHEQLKNLNEINALILPINTQAHSKENELYKNKISNFIKKINNFSCKKTDDLQDKDKIESELLADLDAAFKYRATELGTKIDSLPSEDAALFDGNVLGDDTRCFSPRYTYQDELGKIDANLAKIAKERNDDYLWLMRSTQAEIEHFPDQHKARVSRALNRHSEEQATRLLKKIAQNPRKISKTCHQEMTKQANVLTTQYRTAVLTALNDVWHGAQINVRGVFAHRLMRVGKNVRKNLQSQHKPKLKHKKRGFSLRTLILKLPFRLHALYGIKSKKYTISGS